MFRNYLKTALRNLKKYKGYSFINIAGLAVGLACAVLIFIWAYDELHYDTFHKDSHRIYRMIIRAADNPADIGVPSTPYILPQILKDEFPEVEETVRVRDRGYPSALRYGDISYYENRFFLADASFFTMFSYTFLQGDPATALAKPNALVLTRDAARKYFKDSDPMGKVIRWNNTADLEVTGVIENVPYNSHLQFDCVAPLALNGRERLSSWWRETAGYIKLKEGTALSAFGPKVEGIIQRFHPEDNYALDLQPVRNAHLNIAQGGRGDMRILFIFVVTAVLILIIACFNFMNITTARSGIRSLEVGMRKVVGARRSDIVRQFLGESLLLTLIASALSLILVDLALPTFNAVQGKELSLFRSLGGPLPFILILVVLLTGLFAGSYPAFYLSALQPVKVLRRNQGRRGSVLRSLLVVGQFTISILLIILTIIAHRQMNFIRSADLGFSRQQILRIQMNDQIREDYTSFKRRLLQDPRILSVTAASALPHFLFNVNNFSWEGLPEEDKREINFLYVDHDYAETLGLEMVMGRDFSERFPTDERDAAVVNQACVRMMGFDDPVGKKVTLAGEPKTIIGVVKDFNHKPLIFDISPMVMAIKSSWYFDLIVKVRPGDIPGSLAHMEKIFHEAAPDFPFEPMFLDDFFEMVYSPLGIMNTIFNTFAALAVFISCLGLFGLSALILEQRKKEIGIRKVLGASTRGMMFLLSKRFIRIVLVANLIAIPAALFASRFLLNLFVYRTGVRLSIFLVTVGLSFAAALLTISYQVFKTARTDPVDSIRYE
jgi:putative ABC transport system permease protein